MSDSKRKYERQSHAWTIFGRITMIGNGWAVGLFLVLLPSLLVFDSLQAQTTNDSKANFELASFEGVIIDSILVDNREIFDTASGRHEHPIYRIANHLHFKTRKKIVEREILLAVGKPFSTELAHETARNIRLRLAVFNAWIEPVYLDDGKLLVRVITIDSWSLSGDFDVTQNGSQSTVRFGLTEKNFIGNNQVLSFDYTVESDEEDSFVGSFTEPRLLGRPLLMNLMYRDSPRASGVQAMLARPYYDLAQRVSFQARALVLDGRIDQYQDSVRIASSRFDGDSYLMRLSYRWGPYSRKIRLTGEYFYRFQKASDQQILNGYSGFVEFPDDSLYHQFGMAVTLSSFTFTTARRIDGFEHIEDFTLGHSVAFRFSRAFDRGLGERQSDVFGSAAAVAFGRGNNLFLVRSNFDAWRQGGTDIRRFGALIVQWYNLPSRWLTLAGQFSYFSDWRKTATNNLVLGGTSSVRGFDRFHRTGDRSMKANLEARFFSGLSILSLALNPALFIDFANIWKAREPVRIRDFLIAGGFGLRVAGSRSSKGLPVRVDLGYSEAVGWRISVGTGQFFVARTGISP